MPYSNPDKAREIRRLSKRKSQGYVRCNRAEEFRANYPNANLDMLSLSEREAVKRYHLQGETLKAIALDWDCSREWVRRLIKGALEKLSSMS